MSRAVLGLGSNLGDRWGHLRRVVTGLDRCLVRVSGVYENPPLHGDPDQPMYLNALVVVDDPAASPDDWLDRANELERAAGRVRHPDRPLGPRTLDVDVIAVWVDGKPVVQVDPRLTLPHPRSHRRATVLVPWAEIEPEATLPGYGPIADLLRTEAVAADVPGMRLVGRLRD